MPLGIVFILPSERPCDVLRRNRHTVLNFFSKHHIPPPEETESRTGTGELEVNICPVAVRMKPSSEATRAARMSPGPQGHKKWEVDGKCWLHYYCQLDKQLVSEPFLSKPLPTCHHAHNWNPYRFYYQSSFPDRIRDFSLYHRFQTGSGSHPASYPMVTGAFSPRVKRPGR
jgi:hypothetical protein